MKMADDKRIREVGQCILEFLRGHPGDVEALNEAIMPFAYLTLLKPPRVLNRGTSHYTDGETLPSLQLEFASSRGAGSRDIPAESSESDLEVMSPERPPPDEHPTEIHEKETHDHSLSTSSHSGHDKDAEISHDIRPGENVRSIAQVDEIEGPEIEHSLNQAYSASRRFVNRDHDGKTRRKKKSIVARGTERAKRQKKRICLKQGLQPEQLTSQREDTDSLNPLLKHTRGTASTSSSAPEILTLEERIDKSDDYDQLVSAWMNDPEIVLISQKHALARHEQPQQELLSYLNLIASIGTVDVVRTFAIGLTQLMYHSRLSYEVPAAPNHLLSVEDADTMQCFWRAAYRTQVNASLVSFGVILHRRSLANLRYCYFKAIKSIKCSMERRGLPGHTKTAIARGILLDTVFPGSDKLELKRMSDRLKNDVTRARNYCKLIEYYGSSGILGLLPRCLTDTRMRDFTDAEFDVFLSLISRLRPDLDAERTTTVESGNFSRMRVWGRVIDMAHTGLRPLKEDYDYIQKDTKLLVSGVAGTLEGTSASHANIVMTGIANQALGHSRERETECGIVGRAANAVSHSTFQEDFHTCGPPEIPNSRSRIQEVCE